MMRNYNLIRAILSEPWFISSAEAETMVPLLLSVFRPEHFALDPADRQDLASLMFKASATGGESSRTQTVGVLKITGTLTKSGTWCGYGMSSYARMLREMYDDPEITAIVIDFDTPGGTVAGTEELGNVIKESPKPVIAFISDMACSAGYWLASCCTEIIANNTTAQVGSIGVMCTYRDMSAYYEAMGIKNHSIYAPQSSDKHAESRAVERGDYKITQESLRVLADKFISTVKTNRSGVTDDQLTGKVFFAQDVVGSLIDDIRPFEGALSRAAELAGASSSNHNKKTESMSKQTFIMLALAAGVQALESADGAISLNEEQAAAVEQHLAGLQAKVDAATTAAEALATAKATIETLQGRVEELEKEPADDPATVTKDTDANGSEEGSAQSYAAAQKVAQDFYNNKNQ